MKHIEIFEEGFFLTFKIDSTVLFSLSEALNDSEAKASPLPPVNFDCPVFFELTGYKDTGNQTGRLVELTLTGREKNITAVCFWQFHKGEHILESGTHLTNSCDSPLTVSKDNDTVIILGGESVNF